MGASLSESLDAAWVTVDCEVSSSRRLSETSRRLEGAVIMSYTITIPSTASASAVTTIESMIEDATPTTLKNALNAALSGTDFQILEVTEISVAAVQTVTATSTVTITLQGTTDSHAKGRAMIDAGMPLVLALIVAAFSG